MCSLACTSPATWPFSTMVGARTSPSITPLSLIDSVAFFSLSATTLPTTLPSICSPPEKRTSPWISVCRPISVSTVVAPPGLSLPQKFFAMSRTLDFRPFELVFDLRHRAAVGQHRHDRSRGPEAVREAELAAELLEILERKYQIPLPAEHQLRQAVHLGLGIAEALQRDLDAAGDAAVVAHRLDQHEVEAEHAFVRSRVDLELVDPDAGARRVRRDDAAVERNLLVQVGDFLLQAAQRRLHRGAGLVVDLARALEVDDLVLQLLDLGVRLAQLAGQVAALVQQLVALALRALEVDHRGRARVAVQAPGRDREAGGSRGGQRHAQPRPVGLDDNFLHGQSPVVPSPALSSSPNIRLKHCTAWPAAPFTRLSITARITTRRPPRGR